MPTNVLFWLKVVILDWYSDKKSFSERLNEICPQTMIQNFGNFQFLTALTQKILWMWSLWYETLLNFAWHSMKFHNSHHASKHTKPSMITFLVQFLYGEFREWIAFCMKINMILCTKSSMCYHPLLPFSNIKQFSSFRAFKRCI